MTKVMIFVLRGMLSTKTKKSIADLVPAFVCANTISLINHSLLSNKVLAQRIAKNPDSDLTEPTWQVKFARR